MDFEFDPAKSKANEKKHGIGFTAAQELWADENGIAGPGVCTVEPRRVLLAMLAGKLWTAAFTMRGDRTRIISVRRARENERELYEQAKEEDHGEGI